MRNMVFKNIFILLLTITSLKGTTFKPVKTITLHQFKDGLTIKRICHDQIIKNFENWADDYIFQNIQDSTEPVNKLDTMFNEELDEHINDIKQYLV